MTEPRPPYTTAAPPEPIRGADDPAIQALIACQEELDALPDKASQQRVVAYLVDRYGLPRRLRNQ